MNPIPTPGLLFLAWLLLGGSAGAAIAFDAATECTDATGDITCSHTPVGTPGGVFYIVVNSGSSGAEGCSGGATYGGDTMTHVRTQQDTGTEVGMVGIYFLGTSIPTGTQDAICLSGAAFPKHGVVITVTAVGDTQLAGTGVATGACENTQDQNEENPTCTIGTITGASYGVAGLFSGLNSETATAGAGETIRPTHDFTSQTSYTETSTAQQASGDQVLNFTAGADDAALVGVAIEQVTPDSSGPPPGIINSPLVY